MRISTRHKILAGGLLSLAVLSVYAAPRRSASGISVSAELDSTVVLMGDRTHLRVNIDMPVSAAADARIVDFPEIMPGNDYAVWNGLDVIAADSITTVADGYRRIRYDITLQAFDPGTVTLPPLAVLGANGADTAFSNVLALKVLPVDVDSLETINPLESIVSANSKWYDYVPQWLLWLLVILAFVALGVVAYVTLRKRKEIIEQRRTPAIPPYELAISRLNTLKQRNLAESGHEKEYYTELVDILRQYLQGRFAINAMEMTSSQIVRALRSNPETRMTADQMRSVLSIADFVKFAKVRPLPDDNAKAFARAQNFVEQTKPEPEPEISENGEAQSKTTNTR